MISHDALSTQAGKVASLLLLYVRETKQAEYLVDGAVKASPVELPPREELVARVRFEILCFSTVVIMTQLMPKVLTKVRFFRLKKQVDTEAVLHFNGAFVKEMIERVPSFNAAVRLKEYGAFSSSVDAADHFRQMMGHAFEAGYVIGSISAMREVEPIIDMTGMVVRRAFQT